MRTCSLSLSRKLVIKAEEVGKETIIVEKEAGEASVIAEAVGKDEAVAQKQADAANAIAEECKEPQIRSSRRSYARPKSS